MTGRGWVITVLCVVLSSVSLSFGYSGGTGTPEDPYQIADANDLLELVATTADYSKCFILTADIDLQEQVWTTAIIAPDTDNSNYDFDGTAFTGIFDGNGHKITHFTINGNIGVSYLGLFGQVNPSGSIKNLGLENCTVSAPFSHFVGGLVGSNQSGSISDCYSTGSVSGFYQVGGLVGYNGGNISNCYSTGAVSSPDFSIPGDVGGLVGYNYGTITNCYSTGNVSGSRWVGGLVGGNWGGSISNCYSTSAVSGFSNSLYVGGLVGANLNIISIISNCYSTGAVSGYKYVGGLVGDNEGGGSISNCYSTGSVSGASNSQCVGGLVGYNGGGYNTIINCYSTGAVSGSSSFGVGGLVGSSYGDISHCYSTGSVSGSSGSQYVGGLLGYKNGGSVTSSFWDTDTSGQSTSAGGTGKTTAEMKTMSTFTDAGWDFDTVWDIFVNNTYPFLRVFVGGQPPAPPDIPTNLAQFKSDEQTEIPVGGTTNEPTIIFKASTRTLPPPIWGEIPPNESSNVFGISLAGDRVKLQIELRRLDEYEGQFLDSFTQESELVDSGSQATITVYGLINDNYHWQARTVNETGLASEWVQFGGNSISDSDFIVSEFGTINLETPIMGSTRAFLQWSDYGALDEYRYRIYVREYENMTPIPIDEIDGEEICEPKAIVKDLKTSGIPYVFKVAAVDSTGNEVAISLEVEGTTLNPKKIPIPTNPIVLVPGVGAELDNKDNFFNEIRKYFNEIGWEDAKPASVTYTNGTYESGNVPDGLHWYKNQEPSDYSKPSVFTFVPYVPILGDVGVQHEIGIAQKGIELGYFLEQLGNKGRGNFQLVGHSLGGLTCRAYLQKVAEPMSYKNNVTRFVSTGSPHNGVLDDHSFYEQTYGKYGVRDIVLDGYSHDIWRELDYIKARGPVIGGVGIEIQGIFTFLETHNWDFAGQTLYGKWSDNQYSPSDVLHDSIFLHDLNKYETSQVYGDLPNINYVSLVNRLPSLLKVNDLLDYCLRGLNAYLGYNEGDGFISAESQNLGLIAQNLPAERHVRIVGRYENHYDEQKDFIGILMGLGYPVLSIKSASPVDLYVTAPSGQYITKGQSAMFLTTYTEIYEDGHETPYDLIEIPFPEVGEYKIEVIPELNADPNATYSLVVTRGETITVLAQDAKIADIPQEPYQVAGDTTPVANAGLDQVVYAWIDGIGDVNLDGSDSNDPDGDALSYKWSWTINANTYDANGVKPTIELPVGQYVISLIVNDGIVDSEPNEVVITVIGPVEGNLWVVPKVLNCRSNQPRIMAMMRLPKGITKDQIDTQQPLLLYPGAIKAERMWISRDFDYKCRAWSTTILAWFDKDELMSAIPGNGKVELAVVGQLKTGQYFFGSDTVNVICPGRWPWHRHWFDYRWNRWCRGLGNFRH